MEKDVTPKYEFESALQRRFRQQQEAAVAAAAAVAVPRLAGEERADDDDRMSIDEEEVTPGQVRISATVTPRTASATAPTTTSVSNFNPTANNHTSIPGTATTFKLRSRETLVLQGEYTLRVLAGTISIYGTTLGPESGTNVVYAPITHALPVIEALKSEKRRLDGETFDAIIAVGCSDSGLKDVGRICPLFGRIWKPPGVESEDTFYPVRYLNLLLHKIIIPLIIFLVNRYSKSPHQLPSHQSSQSQNIGRNYSQNLPPPHPIPHLHQSSSSPDQNLPENLHSLDSS